MSRFDIAVVGSINLDISVPVPHLPAPGETVLGGDALWSPGGKGANQAVAAARLGRAVAMVGMVGDDPAGNDLVHGLEADGVVFDGRRIAGVPTGLAAISVATEGRAAGENSIVVSPGANARLTPADVEASSAVATASVVLTQFEVDLGATRAAIDTAAGRVIVNPAPAPGVDRSVVDAVAGADLLVPNQGELAALAGASPATSTDELVEQARSLAVDAVVVTLGSAGALVVDGGRVTPIDPVVVRAVDTTAAGDAFCGGLADALCGEWDLVAAATWAARVAAVAVTRRGAQSSLGTRADALAVG